jgi:hypothetical protein
MPFAERVPDVKSRNCLKEGSLRSRPGSCSAALWDRSGSDAGTRLIRPFRADHCFRHRFRHIARYSRGRQLISYAHESCGPWVAQGGRGLGVDYSHPGPFVLTMASISMLRPTSYLAHMITKYVGAPPQASLFTSKPPRTQYAHLQRIFPTCVTSGADAFTALCINISQIGPTVEGR